MYFLKKWNIETKVSFGRISRIPLYLRSIVIKYAVHVGNWVSAGKYIRFKHRRTFFFIGFFTIRETKLLLKNQNDVLYDFKINKIIKSTLKTCTVISFRLGTNYKNTRDKNRQIFLAPFPCIFQTTISSDSSLDSYLERDLHRPLPILLLFWLSIM